jgi:singapore isolate B (sub-type 7) whole genome shotgun sequence assembly, scaffold_16
VLASQYGEVPLLCVVNCRTATTKKNVNYLLIDPVHLHVKQLYNAYAFFPSITYYRKVELDVGKVESSLTINSLLSVTTIADNWLFGFDAFSSGESLQNQFVGVLFTVICSWER